MAARRRKAAGRDELPAWLWMIFGLAIGLSVALAIWLQQNEGPPPAAVQPAARQAPPQAVDDNGEARADNGPEAPKNRFDFYKMLPNFEVVIPEQEPDVTTDNEPAAVVEAGVYILQAGSFSTYSDADRRRAQLALQGIESNIQRVAIDDKTYHRVRIGPIDDLNELNMLRSRLRAANIDVLRIRLGD
jgi:cell division protein FtsN